MTHLDIPFREPFTSPPLGILIVWKTMRSLFQVMLGKGLLPRSVTSTKHIKAEETRGFRASLPLPLAPALQEAPRILPCGKCSESQASGGFFFF